VSGHARQGELQTLISVAKPDCFIPVHGEYRHMVHHARLATGMGVAVDQVLLCEDGDTVRLDAAASTETARSPPATSTSTARSATSATGCCATVGCWPKRAS